MEARDPAEILRFTRTTMEAATLNPKLLNSQPNWAWSLDRVDRAGLTIKGLGQDPCVFCGNPWEDANRSSEIPCTVVFVHSE